MPSKSPEQARLMAAAAHDPQLAKKVGVPVTVAQEYNQADKGKKLAEAMKLMPDKK
jgi:ribosome assembly protein YihI (activator of Der GTPase)